jgi:hypothetical protein
MGRQVNQRFFVSRLSDCQIDASQVEHAYHRLLHFKKASHPTLSSQPQRNNEPISIRPLEHSTYRVDLPGNNNAISLITSNAFKQNLVTQRAPSVLSNTIPNDSYHAPLDMDKIKSMIQSLPTIRSDDKARFAALMFHALRMVRNHRILSF